MKPLILIVIPRSSVAVGTSHGQCNLSSLRHEIPHSSAGGSFMRALNAQERKIIIIKRHLNKKISMSIQGLKSLRTVLLPCEEKRKCGIVRCCAEFLSIGNHSLKRKRTKGGLSMKRHSMKKWKLKQINDCWGDYGRDGCECSLA